MKSIALLTLVPALALSLPAQAADWTLTFSATAPIWGDDATQPWPEVVLHLVTEDVLTTSTASQSLGEGYRIISFTGTRNGEAVQSVLSPAGDDFFSYGLDNYLYVSTPELVSLQGLGYATADGTRYNLYGATTNMGGTPDTQWFEMSTLPSANPSSPYVTFQGVLSVAAVPEPSSWALLLSGGLLVGLLRRRGAR